MEKKYLVYRIEEMRKRYKDGDIVTELKSDGFHNTYGVNGNLELHTKDAESPNWGDNFLVTIEKLPSLPEGTHVADAYNDIIAKRRAEDNGAKDLPTGRKFR